MFVAATSKPAVQSNRQELLSKDVVLLHDSARPHTAAHTADGSATCLVQTTWRQGAVLLTSDQEVKEDAHAWLAAQPETVFSEDKGKLVTIEKMGSKARKLTNENRAFLEEPQVV